MKLQAKMPFLILCLSAVACSSLMVDKNTHDYPQASKDAFVSSCTKGGAPQQICTCMLGKIEQKYTYGQMEDIEQKIKDGNQPQDFTDFTKKAAVECSAPSSAPGPAETKQPD
ncbi:MAG: hypothetical protein ACJ73D_07900 [Pyrinomonadaceae bacterium]